MSNVVIQVENVSKQYRLGEVGTGSLKDDFKRFRYKLMGKGDPFLEVGDLNDRTKSGKSDYVWALKDINFSIERGEVVGIIGRNGAGKSTLLKLLSRTTGPTTGSIKMKGRIASLLEVGTGFHGELSGRENIYLNGAIMGLRKHEITQKLDEIIDFAGVERYIDTPVKRYSSGMYVRLAFAVAAHLEPDILIVDEVLAVGDAEFQRKCLGKMKDVSTNGGRTVLFVSHNMPAVKTLCQKAITLKNGTIVFDGSVDEAVGEYLKDGSEVSTYKKIKHITSDEYRVDYLKVQAVGKSIDSPIEQKDAICITLGFELLSEFKNYHITYHLYNELGEPVFSFFDELNEAPLLKGFNHISCTMPERFLNSGTFFLHLYIVKNKNTAVYIEKDILCFTVQDSSREHGEWLGREPGYVRPLFSWKTSE